MPAETEIKHVHVFDSEVYLMQFQDRYFGKPVNSGAVVMECECGKRRTFTPSDGQPTKAFWGVDMGSPNPHPESQPPHLAWKE